MGSTFKKKKKKKHLSEVSQTRWFWKFLTVAILEIFPKNLGRKATGAIYKAIAIAIVCSIFSRFRNHSHSCCFIWQAAGKAVLSPSLSHHLLEEPTLENVRYSQRNPYHVHFLCRQGLPPGITGRAGPGPEGPAMCRIKKEDGLDAGAPALWGLLTPEFCLCQTINPHRMQRSLPQPVWYLC